MAMMHVDGSSRVYTRGFIVHVCWLGSRIGFIRLSNKPGELTYK